MGSVADGDVVECGKNILGPLDRSPENCHQNRFGNLKLSLDEWDAVGILPSAKTRPFALRLYLMFKLYHGRLDGLRFKGLPNASANQD